MRIPEWMNDEDLSWEKKEESITSDYKSEPRDRVSVREDFLDINLSRNKQYISDNFVENRWTWTDVLLSIVNPFLILVLLWALVFFLLDVRYIYTAVNDSNLRISVFFYILGIVAVNRIFATERVEDGILYGLLLGMAISLYVAVSTSMYGTGSFIYNLVTGNTFLAFLSNMGLVIFIWWLANRITYECCIDENLSAGEVGITTSLNKAVNRSREARREKKVWKAQEPALFYNLEPVDPTQLTFREPSTKDITFNVIGFGERLSKIPAGISILFFSIPVMIFFSIGLRVLVNGGETSINLGWFYLVLYVFSSAMLLVMTSLGGIREYYKSRKIAIPSTIGMTWVILGTIIIIIAMVVSAYLPLPSLPPPIYVEKHQPDPWARNQSFQLRPMVEVIATPLEIWKQQKMFEKIGYGILFLIGIICVWVIGNGIYRTILYLWNNSLLRERLSKIKLFKLFRFRTNRQLRRKRIKRTQSKSAKFINSLANPSEAKRWTPNQHIEYAYSALCALAEDLGVPKKPSETPLEFLINLPQSLEVLREEIEELTYLYQMASYSPVVLDEKVLDRLRKFWISFSRIRNRIIIPD